MQKFESIKDKALWQVQDPESEWSKTTKGWPYGRKCRLSMDVDSRLMIDWVITKGNIHDSSVSHKMVD